MLYQKEKYGAGSRFLRQGCVLGREALMLWSKCQLEGVGGAVEEDKEGEKEGVWKSLQDGMGKRWELLGVCYSKIGDRKVSIFGFAVSFQFHALLTLSLWRVAHYSLHTMPS